MWKTLCLLTLAVVMLFSASEGQQIQFSCCHKVRPAKANWPIKYCYEQKPRADCKQHAFVITTDSNKTICVKPTPPWLKERINTGKLECPPEFSPQRIFEFLDEDDVE